MTISVSKLTPLITLDLIQPPFIQDFVHLNVQKVRRSVQKRQRSDAVTAMVAMAKYQTLHLRYQSPVIYSCYLYLLSCRRRKSVCFPGVFKRKKLEPFLFFFSSFFLYFLLLFYLITNQIKATQTICQKEIY